jgi:hypothetical protein
MRNERPSRPINVAIAGQNTVAQQVSRAHMKEVCKLRRLALLHKVLVLLREPMVGHAPRSRHGFSHCFGHRPMFQTSGQSSHSLPSEGAPQAHFGPVHLPQYACTRRTRAHQPRIVDLWRGDRWQYVRSRCSRDKDRDAKRVRGDCGTAQAPWISGGTKAGIRQGAHDRVRTSW